MQPLTPTRRGFVRGTATGAVLLGASGLPGCRRTAAPGTPMIPGEHSTLSDHLGFFSVDEPTIARVMAELTARGADAADLYFQHSRDNSITMEDGIISRASSSVDQGVGLRVVVGDQTGYAFTEDLSLAAMLAAARTAASIAHGSKVVPPVAYSHGQAASYYVLTQPCPRSASPASSPASPNSTPSPARPTPPSRRSPSAGPTARRPSSSSTCTARSTPTFGR